MECGAATAASNTEFLVGRLARYPRMYPTDPMTLENDTERVQVQERRADPLITAREREESSVQTSSHRSTVPPSSFFWVPIELQACIGVYCCLFP